MLRNRYAAAGLLFIALIVILGVLSVSLRDTAASDRETAEEAGPSPEETFRITANDAGTEITADEAVSVMFGSDDHAYEITSGGDYVLSGKLNGSVIIDADDEIVHLFMDNVSVRAYEGPALYVISAGKVIITVPEGTESSFRDSTDYSGYKKTKACVFSYPDLTVNGTGKLYVYGDYRDALRSKGVLKILDAELYVRAKDDGVRGNDGLLLMPGTLSVECEATGITTSDSDNGKGDIDIKGGSIHVIAGEYGIRSAGDLSISSCEADIHGVYGEYKAAGDTHIEEGCLTNGQ